MYINGEYTHFSLTDVNRFERWLNNWCTQECTHGKSMLVFDYTQLKVEGKHSIEVRDNQVFHHYVLPNITLEFIFISKNMCVMTSIWETKTLSALYRIPDSWRNVGVWPAT